MIEKLLPNDQNFLFELIEFKSLSNPNLRACLYQNHNKNLQIITLHFLSLGNSKCYKISKIKKKTLYAGQH